MVHAFPGVHIGIHGQWLECPGVPRCTQDILMPDAHVLPLEAMLMDMVCVATAGHVNICSPCYQCRPCGYLWPVLLPEIMLTFMLLPWLGAVLISESYGTTTGHVDIHGLCCYLKSFDVYGPCCH